MFKRDVVANAKKRRASLLKQFNKLCAKTDGYTKTEFAALHGISKERIGKLLEKAKQESEIKK